MTGAEIDAVLGCAFAWEVAVTVCEGTLWLGDWGL